MFQRLFGLCGYVPANTLAPPVDPREAHKTKLRKALSRDKYKFRFLYRLMTIIKSDDESYTRGLLAEIGARESYRDSDLFGLTSRVGYTGRRTASRY